MKWLREQGVNRCDTWLGISTDEAHRQRLSAVRWNQNHYPLIELGLSRTDCKKEIAMVGWPEPEHSHCFMCPMQSNSEWLSIKTNWPEDWKRAVGIEAEIQEVDPTVFLHHSCKRLPDISIGSDSTEQLSFWECFGSGDCQG
jgi:hypothetical protein